jgi:hypothetical protein
MRFQLGGNLKRRRRRPFLVNEIKVRIVADQIAGLGRTILHVVERRARHDRLRMQARD